MKCKNCKYCEFVELDGYSCKKFNSHIPFELIDIDLDCMVRDYDSMTTQIFIDKDGCKNIKSLFYSWQSFNDILINDLNFEEIR